MATMIPPGRRRLLALGLVLPFTPAAGPASAAERKIGWISPDSPEIMATFLAAFRAGLADVARPGDPPITVEQRFASSGLDAIPGYVRELERLGVQLIVAQGTATSLVMDANPAVPIVFGYSGDPVVAGFTQSLARPNRNATGMTFLAIELSAKRVAMVRDVLPGCRRIGLLSNARHPGEEQEIAACQRTVARFGIDLAATRVPAAPELRMALSQALDQGAEAIVALPSALMVQQRSMLAEVCLERRVPLISGWSEMAHAGALFTYGPNLRVAYRRVAHFVAQILRGASPADLPIELPTVLELVVNLRTAKALGLTLPAWLLAKADEVIE